MMLLPLIALIALVIGWLIVRIRADNRECARREAAGIRNFWDE